MPVTQVSNIPVGGVFTWRGKRYVKIHATKNYDHAAIEFGESDIIHVHALDLVEYSPVIPQALETLSRTAVEEVATLIEAIRKKWGKDGA